jgi:hypothetical protein
MRRGNAYCRTPVNIRTFALPVAVALIAASPALAQGPLNPPGGPAPTMKSLDEINAKIEQAIGKVDQVDAKVEKRIPISSLPFTITAPGSYYLTGNLTHTGTGNGITVESDQVTIDLMGFTLANSTPGTGFGIFVAGGASFRRYVTVKNGFVSGWQFGLNLGGRGFRVDGVTVSANQTGISCASTCVVVDTVAVANTGTGISVAADGVVLRSVARENGGNGISTVNAGLVAHCTSRDNGGFGIGVGESSTVQQCAVFDNASNGISATNGCTVARNTVRSGGANGVSVGGSSLVLENDISNHLGANAAAILSGSNSRIEANHCSTNTRGIVTSGTGNFIVKNTVIGASQYVVPAGNKVGVIVVPTSNGAAINGSSGGGLGTSDPWANFAY